jgi:hypothetical protein
MNPVAKAAFISMMVVASCTAGVVYKTVMNGVKPGHFVFLAALLFWAYVVKWVRDNDLL